MKLNTILFVSIFERVSTAGEVSHPSSQRESRFLRFVSLKPPLESSLSKPLQHPHPHQKILDEDVPEASRPISLPVLLYWGALNDVKISFLHLKIIAAGTAARKYSMMNPIKSINNIKARIEKVG